MLFCVIRCALLSLCVCIAHVGLLKLLHRMHIKICDIHTYLYDNYDNTHRKNIHMYVP